MTRNSVTQIFGSAAGRRIAALIVELDRREPGQGRAFVHPQAVRNRLNAVLVAAAQVLEAEPGERPDAGALCAALWAALTTVERSTTFGREYRSLARRVSAAGWHVLKHALPVALPVHQLRRMRVPSALLDGLRA